MRCQATALGSVLGFRVQGSGAEGFAPLPTGSRPVGRVSSVGVRVSGFGFWVSVFGIRVSGGFRGERVSIPLPLARRLSVVRARFNVSDFGFQVSGFGFLVSGLLKVSLVGRRGLGLHPIRLL